MSVDRWVGTGRRPALVISECQNGLINPEHATTMTGLAEQATSRGIVPRIAALADSFRAQGLPVAHAWIVPAPDFSGFDRSSPLAAHTIKAGLFREGRPEVDPHPGLEPHEGDLVFPRRTGMTAFFRSGLGAALREQEVDTVVLVGISTNVAIPGTTVEAVNRGLPVVVAEDATAGTTAEVHAFTVQQVLPVLATLTTSGEVTAALGRR